MTQYICKKMIEDGLMAKAIVPSLDDVGLTCHIGDYWFFFGGQEFEHTNPKEISFSTIVEEIKLVLDDFYEDINNGNETLENEYLYYYHYLCENI